MRNRRQTRNQYASATRPCARLRRRGAACSVGVQSMDDFAPILQRIALAPKLTPMAVRMGGAEGLSLDVTDSGVTARTAILSIGRRRIVIVRGVATADAWGTGASDQLDKLIA